MLESFLKFLSHILCTFQLTVAFVEVVSLWKSSGSMKYQPILFTERVDPNKLKKLIRTLQIIFLKVLIFINYP